MTKKNENGQNSVATSAKDIRIVVATDLENGKVIFAKVARNNAELGTILGLVSIKAQKNEGQLLKVSDSQYYITDAEGVFANVQVVESVIG